MKLTQLAVDNFKRISVAVINIDPDKPGTVALMGKNEAGKSSALDALEVLLAGRKAPKIKQPVHAGADKASIIATFRDDDGVVITVRRTYKADGGTAIEVRQVEDDGSTVIVKRPDDLLRRLYSHVAFDPLEFANLESKAQTETLLKLIGFDPSALDTRRANLYATRTQVGQEVTRLKGQLDGFPEALAELPDAISVADARAELDAAVATHHALEGAEFAAGAASSNTQSHDKHVEQLREELEQAEADAKAAEQAEIAAEAALRDARAALIDPGPIRAKIDSAQAHNDRITVELGRRRVVEQLDTAKAEVQRLTDTMAEVDAEKVAGFASAKMPVPGLTVVDGEVHLDGTPFSQTSAGGKLRTSVAIAMALQPDLRAILVRDGALLDGDNRKIIDQLAKANDFTVLMEIVDESEAAGVVFEDGQIARVKP